MDNFVTDTQALMKFIRGKKVINDRSHQVYLKAYTPLQGWPRWADCHKTPGVYE